MSLNYSNKKAEGFTPVQGSWAELHKILLELLDRRQYLMPYAREFTVIDDALQKYFAGVPSCTIGAYEINGAFAQRTDLRGAPGKDLRESRQWLVDIKKNGAKTSRLNK